MSLIYRCNPKAHFCSCPAYGFSKPKQGRKQCKHLKHVFKKPLTSKWYVHKIGESRWIAQKEDVAFVATDTIDFIDLIGAE